MIIGEATHVCGKSLYLPLNFVVNLKLLLKKVSLFTDLLENGLEDTGVGEG